MCFIKLIKLLLKIAIPAVIIGVVIWLIYFRNPGEASALTRLFAHPVHFGGFISGDASAMPGLFAILA